MAMSRVVGTILKSLSGFYYVEVADTAQVVECRACGRFRKTGEKPLSGDHVEIRIEGDSGYIEQILPRMNQLTRPPVANIDQLLLIVSMRDPAPSTLVIDKLLAIAESQQIAPAIAFSKTDLADAQALYRLYTDAGFLCFMLSSKTGEGVDALYPYLEGKVTVLTGNTGAGKSSLLNALYPKLRLATGEVSQKLGRGRHTTRQVEFLHLPHGGLVADTPGFSSITPGRYDLFDAAQLPHYFREFVPYLGQCRFQGCAHTCEKGCAVLQAVQDGKIAPSRHASYLAMLAEIKETKEWDRR